MSNREIRATVTVDGLISKGTVQTDQIIEKTPGASVTIDGIPVTDINNPTLNIGESFADAINQLADAQMFSVVAATTASLNSLAVLVPGYVLDGVTLQTNDYVLIWRQNFPSVYNGIYKINAVGVPTRADFYNSDATIRGSIVRVQGGIKNGGKLVRCGNINTITPDTSYIFFYDMNNMKHFVRQNVVYIAWDRGNDLTGDGTFHAPFYSIQQALKVLPQGLSPVDTASIKIRFITGGMYFVGNILSSGTWAVGTTYVNNQGVTYNGKIYRSKVAGNVGNTPTLVPDTDAYWELMNWDAGATYAKYKVVQLEGTDTDGSYPTCYFYRSKIDNNTGNALTDTNSWELIGSAYESIIFDQNMGQGRMTDLENPDNGVRIQIVPVMNPTLYDGGTTYGLYDVVKTAGDELYYSKVAGNVGNPVTDANYWTTMDTIWEYLYHGFTQTAVAANTFAAVDFPTSPTKHVSTVSPAWTVNAYRGKFLKPTGVNSGSLPTLVNAARLLSYRDLFPIESNDANSITCTRYNALQAKDDWSTFEIYDINTTFNFAANAGIYFNSNSKISVIWYAANILDCYDIQTEGFSSNTATTNIVDNTPNKIMCFSSCKLQTYNSTAAGGVNCKSLYLNRCFYEITSQLKFPMPVNALRSVIYASLASGNMTMFYLNRAQLTLLDRCLFSFEATANNRYIFSYGATIGFGANMDKNAVRFMDCSFKNMGAIAIFPTDDTQLYGVTEWVNTNFAFIRLSKFGLRQSARLAPQISITTSVSGNRLIHVGKPATGWISYDGVTASSDYILPDRNVEIDLSQDENLRVSINKRVATIKPAAYHSIQQNTNNEAGVWTNITAEMSTTGGTPTTFLSTTTEAIYFGTQACEHTRLHLNLATVADTAYTLSLAYWDGTSWTALTGWVDGTSGLTQSGDITFTPRANWTSKSLNSVSGYYVRLMASVVPTTKATVKFVSPSSNSRLAVYANEGDAQAALEVTKDGDVLVGTTTTSVVADNNYKTLFTIPIATYNSIDMEYFLLRQDTNQTQGTRGTFSAWWNSKTDANHLNGYVNKYVGDSPGITNFEIRVQHDASSPVIQVQIKLPVTAEVWALKYRRNLI